MTVNRLVFRTKFEVGMENVIRRKGNSEKKGVDTLKVPCSSKFKYSYNSHL